MELSRIRELKEQIKEAELDLEYLRGREGVSQIQASGANIRGRGQSLESNL